MEDDNNLCAEINRRLGGNVGFMEPDPPQVDVGDRTLHIRGDSFAETPVPVDPVKSQSVG